MMVGLGPLQSINYKFSHYLNLANNDLLTIPKNQYRNTHLYELWLNLQQNQNEQSNNLSYDLSDYQPESLLLKNALYIKEDKLQYLLQ